MTKDGLRVGAALARLWSRLFALAGLRACGCPGKQAETDLMCGRDLADCVFDDCRMAKHTSSVAIDQAPSCSGGLPRNDRIVEFVDHFGARHVRHRYGIEPGLLVTIEIMTLLAIGRRSARSQVI